MKAICLVFVILLATVNSKGVGVILNIILSSLLTNTMNPASDEVQEKDVKFYLVTNQDSSQRIELNATTFDQVNRGDLVKIIVHGWLESSSRQWVQNITQEYLRKGSYNVIQVDYAKPASERYGFAIYNVRPVGELVGNLIVNLYINYGVPLANFHIIGHSLGAHVSGYAGKHVNQLIRQKIPRITALDAAGPFFEIPPIFNLEGLRKDDADLLDAIHTDGGIFGYRSPLGTVDFFPNGGVAVQPSCPPISLTSIISNTQDGLDD
ncbi:hypothetical protein ILUMI_19820, partial [Ignelater luminosus]